MSFRFEDVAERFWNWPTKGEEEARREELFMDDIIQKAHLDREIARHLAGVKTVFDGGAGAGRFTIPLAKRGLRVTHFDISRPMLDTARQYAEREGVAGRIEFVQGRLTELSAYRDGQFDLVISFDAPVSYTYPDHERVLSELVRIAKKAVIVSVSSRLGWLPYSFNPAHKQQYLLNPDSQDPLLKWYKKLDDAMVEAWQPDFAGVEQLLATGCCQDTAAMAENHARGHVQWPVNYLFMPDELKGMLERAGLRDVQLSGPGALARSIPQPLLRKLLTTPEYRERFLDLCHRFDSQPWVAGLGKDNLTAAGRKG
jgi:2-polyprenyl-3-methyl-5-hydroxy-6-metoxy-1,4-benzoquinol methylase